jgi:hypothetical protein
MRRTALVLTFFLSASAAGAAERIDLRLDASQAEATLAIVEAHAAGKAISDADWQRLFATEPYRRLEKREASLQRPFTPQAFREFALSPDLVARAAELRRTLAAWKKADLEAAAARILPYLPADARLRARVYPVIKPRSNSFVFETTTDPAIFLYLDPKMSDAQFVNTVAHELHHIGLGSLAQAYDARLEKLPANAHQAANWMGAFGEGLAVLAAAGSTEVHPMAAFPPEDRTRWDRDVEDFDQYLPQLDRFFLDIVEGGFAKPEVADHVAFTFFGYRGPWYTVGYRMGAVVEKRFGRAALVECMSDPRRLLERYNQAAAAENATGGDTVPLWSPELLQRVADPMPGAPQ